MHIQIQESHIAANGDINIANQTVTNLYHSANWQELQKREQELRKNIAAFETIAPSNESIQSCLREAYQNLQTVLQQQQDFKRDVLKLAEDFQRIELNTERLQQAYAYFQQGEFDKARAVLDTEAMQSEQTRLLEQKDKLARQTAENKEALAHNAQEWLLKARLIALDYSLKEQRIAQARAAFETALKSERSANILFQYAYFLQENNQYDDAVSYYKEVLTTLCQLAGDNQQDIAMTLNNLAILLAENPSHHSHAEKFFCKALTIYLNLAKQQPKQYEPDIARIFTHLATLWANKPSMRRKAQTYFVKALIIYHKLSQQQPELFNENISNIYNNIGILLSCNILRHRQAEKCFQKALALRRHLVSQNPDIFEQYLSDTLNNLANLLASNPSRYNDAKEYYAESLSLYDKLAQKQPEVFETKVSAALNNLAALLTNNSTRYDEIAEKYYQKALAIRCKLAKQHPTLYSIDVAQTLNNLALLITYHAPSRYAEALKYYRKALNIYRRLMRFQPDMYLPPMVETLFNFALLYCYWNKPTAARPLAEEAAALIAPYAERYPQYFGELQQEIQNLLNKLP